MDAIHNINLNSLLNTFISLSVAFILGSLIGLERQFRQRTAGLRTNVLVSVGAAIFVDAANRLYGHEGAVRVISYVVSGVGFLGAGAIMRGEGNVQGINTAATLWGAAAVGACAGADLILEAFMASLFVLASNTLLRPIVNQINRQPLNVESVEVTNIIYIIANRQNQKQALEIIEKKLEEIDYPIREVKIHPFGESEIEIQVTLLSTSVVSADLDNLLQGIGENSIINQAFWSPSTTE